MKILEIPLFREIQACEFAEMEHQHCMRRQKYEKTEQIFRAGDHIEEIGIVLSGSVIIENIDFWGHKSILSYLGPGQVFAETYALCREPMMVDVLSAELSEVLFLNLQVLLDQKNRGHSWYLKILHNLLQISVHKNLMLSHRIFCTTPKNVRGRLLTYLSAQAVKNGSMEFTIPFTRQQMADYLNLDRSALSKELCRMRDEGLLTFYKNRFTLIQLNQP